MTVLVKRPVWWWGDLQYLSALWTAEREQQRHAAVNAEALLLSLLPPGEQQRYRLTKRFYVTGSNGGVYEITHGVTGNVRTMPDDYGLCAHLPIFRDEDIEFSMVAQLLNITTDETGFLAVANRW